jgi:hypothetical protein
MKLLGKPIVPEFHGDVTRNIEVNGKKFDAEGNRYVAVFHRVSVTGETPKINGWTFCGTIDHRAGGNILRSVPGAGELPIKFRSVDAICEHCGVARRRNDTFILRCAATGEYKQIGKQCLRDFIGYDVAAFAESAKWLSSLEPSDSDGEGGYGGYGGQSRDIMLTKYLAHAHACIRKFGWVSAKDAEIRDTRRTSSAAMENMFPLPKYRHLALPLTDRDYQIAEQAVAWVRGIIAPRGDYEYNLTVVAAGEFITYRDIGLAASMIQGLYRHQEQTIKRAERLVSLKNSQHLGAIKERLRDLPALVYGYRAFESAHGSSHLFRLRTPEGNVILWWASKAQDLSIGDNVLLTGTVVKHTEYENVKQTTLSRCKITMLPKPELEEIV